MYYREHGRPHFHAVYGEYEVVIDVANGALVSGNMPSRALDLIQQWYALHQMELAENAVRASRHQVLRKVAPLE
jgi:hypothetical protein